SQHAEPSHRLAAEVAAEPRFAVQLAGVAWQTEVLEPGEYLELLVGLGMEADVWQTIYLHRLAGEDPVLSWLEGTTLRPLLAALPGALAGEYRAALAPRLAAAYPRGVFPFRRTFFVARHRTE